MKKRRKILLSFSGSFIEKQQRASEKQQESTHELSYDRPYSRSNRLHRVPPGPEPESGAGSRCGSLFQIPSAPHVHRRGGHDPSRLYPAQEADGSGKAAGLFRSARDPDRADRRLWKPAGFYGYFQSHVQAKPCRLPEAAAILSPAVCVSAVQAAFLPRSSSLSGRLRFLP